MSLTLQGQERGDEEVNESSLNCLAAPCSYPSPTAPFQPLGRGLPHTLLFSKGPLLDSSLLLGLHSAHSRAGHQASPFLGVHDQRSLSSHTMKTLEMIGHTGCVLSASTTRAGFYPSSSPLPITQLSNPGGTAHHALRPCWQHAHCWLLLPPCFCPHVCTLLSP
jgi:hypothetical protein